MSKDDRRHVSSTVFEPPRASDPAEARTRFPTVLGTPSQFGPRSLAQLFRPQVTAILRGFLLLALTNACALSIPRLVNVGVDLVEGRQARPLLGVAPNLANLTALIVVLALLGAVVRTASRMVLFHAGRDVERNLRQETFAHLTTLSPSYFATVSIGDLMSRVTNDLTNLRLLAGFALLNAFNALIVAVVTVPLCLLLDWRVALWSLLPFPLVIVAAQLVSRTMFRRTKQAQEATGNLTALVQEVLAGQMVVRAFSQETAVEERFGCANDEAYVAAMRLAKVRLLMGPLMGLMGSVSIAIALAAGGVAVVEGRMSVGDVVEMNTRLLQLTWPMIALGFILSVWQRGRASLARINELFIVVPDIVDGPRMRPAKALRGTVAISGLTVELAAAAPDMAPRRILSDISGDIASGAFVGVVGRNASGKSVLLKCLARQRAVAAGQVFLDDVDVVDWHLSALRSAPFGVAVVPEDGFLFSASLRDNLTFGATDVSDRDVEAVVDLVDLRRDVERFPDGLATIVGERGVTLSGGQRQRVALGRALLARPSLLLLDDCLSAVDVETERNIISALQRGFALGGSDGDARPTIVLVSHRLSALRTADDIWALADGRIVERGTHEQLVHAGGLYAALWGEEQKKQALQRRLATEGVVS
jgi:ATP-binding cassette subfamily B multidrug efflux pump